MKLFFLAIVLFCSYNLMAQVDSSDYELALVKQKKCKNIGIGLTTGAATFTVLGGGLFGDMVYEAFHLDPNVDPPKNLLGISISGATILCMAVPLWIAGPIEIAKGRHLKKILKGPTAKLTFYPDIVNTALVGYHPSPTMGLRLAF